MIYNTIDACSVDLDSSGPSTTTIMPTSFTIAGSIDSD